MGGFVNSRLKNRKALTVHLLGRTVDAQLPVIVAPAERFDCAYQISKAKPGERRANVVLGLRIEQ